VLRKEAAVGGQAVMGKIVKGHNIACER
jgi:hypothetical protein